MGWRGAPEPSSRHSARASTPHPSGAVSWWSSFRWPRPRAKRSGDEVVPTSIQSNTYAGAIKKNHANPELPNSMYKALQYSRLLC